MEGRIAHLRSHYRVAGAQVSGPAVMSRLDRLLRHDVIRNCDEALESALAGDESVYVVRRVKARTSIVLDADATDAAVAKRWGSHLAAAVMRAIARGDNDSGNVVRFENQADYVASFLVALLKGAEHSQWFFGAFSEVQRLDKKTAIKRVLLDNIAHVPAILAHVHRYGELDALIASLDAATKRALWSPASEQRDDLEISRSLFTAALQVLERLGGRTAAPQDRDELFRCYCETDPPFADWRDPRSLAESVLEVVRHFVARGYFSSPGDAGELSIRLAEALADFEWLDREWLRSSVLELFAARDHAAPDLPLRVSSGRATPRQRELLAAIAGAIGDTNIDGRDPLAASLKILALLVSIAPGWAEDAAAKVMIENLLAAASAVPSSYEQFVQRLRTRDVEGALRLLPSEQRESARDACQSVAALGDPAVELLEKLTRTDAKALAVGFESECAGLALLLRPMIDARLHALADEDAFPVKSQWPPAVMLFILVAQRIAGDKAFVDGSLEPGLCLLAGLENAPTLDEIHGVWREAETADFSNFQKALLEVAAGQRLIGADHDPEKTGKPNLDQTTTFVTRLLLRMWARWLRGFSDASVDFLLDNFIRRTGRLYVDKDLLLVELERRPLDVVLEMAGYLADLERVPWLPGKRIKFSLAGS